LIVATLGISGFFMSFLFTAYNALAFADVEPAQMGAATSFYSTFQQLTLPSAYVLLPPCSMRV